MQVTLSFDPQAPDQVEAALSAIMAFNGDQSTTQAAAAAVTRVATGPTPEAADTKSEQETAAAEAAEAKKAEAAEKRKAAAAKKKAEEEAAAAAEAEAKEKAEAGAESTGEADPLAGGGDEAETKAPTQAEVLKALQNYREIEGTDAVIALLKEHDATHIKDLKEEHYASVFKAAS